MEFMDKIDFTKTVDEFLAIMESPGVDGVTTTKTVRSLYLAYSLGHKPKDSTEETAFDRFKGFEALASNGFGAIPSGDSVFTLYRSQCSGRCIRCGYLMLAKLMVSGNMPLKHILRHAKLSEPTRILNESRVRIKHCPFMLAQAYLYMEDNAIESVGEVFLRAQMLYPFIDSAGSRSHCGMIEEAVEDGDYFFRDQLSKKKVD